MKTGTIKFTKGGHHYVFRYRRDMQDEMIDHIAALAADDEYNIDWLDAATMSFRIAQKAACGDSDVLTQSIKQK